MLGSRCWHPIMWQEPPEPPKPKKKKTKTQLDEEGNELIIELSEDESSDEEDQVIECQSIDIFNLINTCSLSLSLFPIPLECHAGAAASSHYTEY